MSDSNNISALHPRLPRAAQRMLWGRLYGASPALAIAAAAREHHGPLVVVTPDMPATYNLERELRFFLGASDAPQTTQGQSILAFPDWETLPYDIFSPHQDIVSQRLLTLYQLPGLTRGILVLPIATLMQRLAPRGYVDAHSLLLETGAQIDIDLLLQRLARAGYSRVSQVMEHGEFAVRGNLIDIFPMGAQAPYRVDLFDDEIESIRVFDAESQRSISKTDAIRMLPAREFPLDEDAIARFRQAFRERFPGNPQNVPLYRDVSQGLAPAGIEYYLPLFFQQTDTLFDYLPDNALFLATEGLHDAAQGFAKDVAQRYESGRYDLERPLLTPDELFLNAEQTLTELDRHPLCELHPFSVEHQDGQRNFATSAPPALTVNARAPQPHAAMLKFLEQFLQQMNGRVLFAADTAGRRELLLEMLHGHDLRPLVVDNWNTFMDGDAKLAITVASLERGLLLEQPRIAVIAETQLFGEQVKQRRRRRTQTDTEAVVRNLTELNIGSPVVHEEHGVGRYLGLQKLSVANSEGEFLTLEYAGGDKLYVPVAALHLISRYTGAGPDEAPLHKLGGEQWSRAKRRAIEKARDVAAELLDVYARRAARQGHAFPSLDEQYAAFTAAFPFEETPDQEHAINDVIADMLSDKPMDRLICGDVGFGKTEVAMRAAFIAVQGGKQVSVLVPTTLLAQQHYENFRDRFADWPVRIEALSRFGTGKKHQETIADLETGKVDIVIGTHKLLQAGIKFKDLGLAVIDEEHRFGVRQKERLKALRAEVDILTLTATPIPRTLNMAMSQIRDLSVISTPPSNRLSIKTFVREWNDALLNEGFRRELKRGGQVYFLHNEVKSIDKMAETIEALIPEASVRVAHGQMRESELERVMTDFYHQRFNVLVCTTIIETGIDVPSANTIIINRADKLGLAQLYQLRGRVGRSHHRAYAYLIVPPKKAMTADAVKRLQAIESIEDLGTGFMLATHDLEIRGAGELLGDEQSGQIHEIGFSMYTELLERAVMALKQGKQPELETPLHQGTQIELQLPALIPDDYLPDVHTRLIMYKRIASAKSDEDLKDLQVEMIDRFGLLPEQSKNLFRVTALRLKATAMGIHKIDIGSQGGRLIFDERPRIDPARLISLIQTQPQTYRFDGKDKLRLAAELPEAEQRFQAVHDLLDQLEQRDAA